MIEDAHWEDYLNVMDAVLLTERLDNWHLFDVMIKGAFGILTAGVNSRQAISMFSMYPCGTVFIGGFQDSNSFDMEFGLTPKSIRINGDGLAGLSVDSFRGPRR